MLHNSAHSVPSLSHSSSSPAADIAAFDYTDDQIINLHRPGHKIEPERNDFDNFLDYSGVDAGIETSGTDNFFII